MKKLVLLGLLVLFFVTPYRAYAQEMEATDAAEVTQEEIVYALPYPGLLPDNPFYGIKMFRDNLVGFLISDPLKKAEFNLLQADKRLQSGVTLIEKDNKKSALAIATITKGQNYFDQAIGKLHDAKKQGAVINDLAGKMLTASKKHQDVLTGLEKKIAKEQAKELAAAIKKVEEFETKLTTLLEDTK